MESAVRAKESNLGRVERVLKEQGVVVVGPRVGSCDYIEGECASVNFCVAPGGQPLLSLDKLKVFSNELHERLGPSEAAHEAKAYSWSVDMPRFVYRDSLRSGRRRYGWSF